MSQSWNRRSCRLYLYVILNGIVVSFSFTCCLNGGAPSLCHVVGKRTKKSLKLWVNHGGSIPPDFTILDDNDGGDGGDGSDRGDRRFYRDDSQKTSSRPEASLGQAYFVQKERPKRDFGYQRSNMKGDEDSSWRSNENRGPSWQQRNRKGIFPSDGETRGTKRPGDYRQYNDDRQQQRMGRQAPRWQDRPPTTTGKSFRQDFRGTRVFIQGIPDDTSWQDLKDHFRLAGEVVFASVSRDPVTGESKGHGVVQYETTDMAQTAIAMMRNHPLNGQTLFVRADYQEESDGAVLRNNNRNQGQQRNIQAWSCADDENSMHLSDSDRTEVESLIRARDDARRRRNYEVSDNIREELKIKFSVYLDDRLKMWWVSIDGENVPQVIHDIKGGGSWNKGGEKEAWRQIPTTPENDACVNPDLVHGLLAQRDIARREKDFQTADALLQQARNAPDGDLYLRIHDESRTWRVWTDEPPPKPFAPHLSPSERCIAIVEEHDPEKVADVKLLLEKFTGREYQILKRLKQRYLQE
ncbi:hypothetical protein ACA910_000893 [Epithemia clementina (nom. ined.)]